MYTNRRLSQSTYVRTFLLFSFLVLVAAGCGQANSELTGKWVYQPPDVGNVSSFSKAKQAAIKSGQNSMAKWSLDLRPDHTFTLFVLQPIEGTWTADQSTVTLNTQRFLAGVAGPAQEWKRTIKATRSSDGSILKIDRNNPLLPMEFVFRK
jgi:hypothetical protein